MDRILTGAALPNQSVERMGASRPGQPQFGRQWRLAPTAHTRRWAHMRWVIAIPFVLLLNACSRAHPPRISASPDGQSYAQYSSTNDTIERFKWFLQSSPAISNVVFDRQVLVTPGPEGLQPHPNEIQHFQGAWQTNAYFIRRLNSLQELDGPIYATTSTAGLLFAGRADDKLWYIVNTNVHLAWADDPGNSGHPVAGISMEAGDMLSSTLAFGIERMKPGSLTWKGNAFAARSDVLGNIQGALEVSNGVPMRMIVKYEGQKFGYIAEYAYSNENRLPYGIPNQIYEVFVQGDQSVPQTRNVMLAIHPAPDALPLAFFSPERFIRAEKEYVMGAVHRSRAPLRGEPLPDLAPLGFAPGTVPTNKPVLLCLFDLEQRPSRRILRQLAEQHDALCQKGLTILGFQAAAMPTDSFKGLKDANPAPFPIGRFEQNSNKTTWVMQVPSLPWLILSDYKGRVVAEGFGLDELDAKVRRLSD
jgi:hypothetical protein